ncbi:TolC family protein [Variovorax rhizosphaerae]|uniref:TolC family protein n=1 Tax=Variovorax rhizosphaerae TaxID=1836200 RepID=A0ABU8WDQ4_9BURK
MQTPHPSASRPTRLRAIGLYAAATLIVAGCGFVQPEKISERDVALRARIDQERIYRAQEPLVGPVTFSTALARALKYNLDYRLKLMESALSRGLLDVSNLDLLPRVVVDAGYYSRNNDSGGTSIGIEDRQISLRASTSEERQHSTARAALSWNALDFGIGYFRAKQAADEYNIAEERRRKILHNIVQDVRNAYWRAVSAQLLLGEADALLLRIRDAVGKSQEAERAGVLPPGQALAYQRALLDAMTLVNVKRQEMEFAKRELAALMSVTPGTDFDLADTPDNRIAAVPVNVGELEQLALENRPELAEEDYRARIGVNEARKQIAALFPSLNLYAGASYDSNRFLYNNNWADAGVNLSVNLVRLLAYPTIKSTNEARAETDQARRLALTMAVITQVRVSVERYKLTVLDYELAAESSRVDQRLASVSRAGSSNKLESELESLRTDSRALVSRFQLATAYASTQAAYGRIMNSVGIDLLPEEVESSDIPTLAKAIEASLVAGERDAFLIPAVLQARSRAVSVRVLDLAAGIDAGAVRGAVENVISRNDVVVLPSGAPLLLTMRYGRLESKATARAQWRMALTGPGDKPVLSRDYVSFLPGDAPQRSINAFAEAAALSVLTDVRKAASEDNGK